MPITQQELMRIAREVGALDPTTTASERAGLLRKELERSARGGASCVVFVREERDIVVLVKLDDTDKWQEYPLLPDQPTPPTRAPGVIAAEARRRLEDATILGMADLLEAKYRTDQFRKHYLRGTPSDPTLFHDAVELGMRTLREATTLSVRTQRSLATLVRELLPQAPPRPRPRLETPTSVRLRWVELERQGKRHLLEGRFVLRNDRATHLRLRLEPQLQPEIERALLDVEGATCRILPEELVLAPGAQQSMTVRLEPKRGASLPTSFELSWRDPRTPLAAIELHRPLHEPRADDDG